MLTLLYAAGAAAMAYLMSGCAQEKPKKIYSTLEGSNRCRSLQIWISSYTKKAEAHPGVKKLLSKDIFELCGLKPQFGELDKFLYWDKKLLNCSQDLTSQGNFQAARGILLSLRRYSAFPRVQKQALDFLEDPKIYWNKTPSQDPVKNWDGTYQEDKEACPIHYAQFDRYLRHDYYLLAKRFYNKIKKIPPHEDSVPSREWKVIYQQLERESDWNEIATELLHIADRQEKKGKTKPAVLIYDTLTDPAFPLKPEIKAYAHLRLSQLTGETTLEGSKYIKQFLRPDPKFSDLSKDRRFRSLNHFLRWLNKPSPIPNQPKPPP